MFPVAHNGDGVSPDHQTCEVLWGGRRRVLAPDDLAESQNSYALADVHHFFKLVRDDNHRQMFLLKFAQNRKEAFHILRRQDSGWLIKNQYTAVAIQCLEDFDSLLLPHRQITYDG